jgi:hypothetical protein
MPTTVTVAGFSAGASAAKTVDAANNPITPITNANRNDIH